MANGPTLETARLILRPPLQEDLDGWTNFSSDPECMRFIGGARGRDETWRAMATMAGSWVLQGFGMFSVIEKSTGEMIGRLGPWQPGGASCGWPGTEVGWGLVRGAWGKGYATEGSAAAMDFAVDVLGWTDIIHTIDPANVGSQKVAAGIARHQHDVRVFRLEQRQLGGLVERLRLARDAGEGQQQADPGERPVSHELRRHALAHRFRRRNVGQRLRRALRRRRRRGLDRAGAWLARAGGESERNHACSRQPRGVKGTLAFRRFP
jgi:RimJ/RimL family protein N-acetyltransferase